MSLFISCSGPQEPAIEPQEPASGDTNITIKNEMDKFSYALGVSMASQMTQFVSFGLDSLNMDIYLQAVRETVLKKELQIPVDEANQFVRTYMMEMRDKMMNKTK